jgi:predicted amidohydrolase YtcJ
VYSGQIVSKVLGPDASRRAPPIKTALKMGLHVAAGTDSDQVAPYNPFVSIRWLLDGKVIDGTPMRGPEESPNREEALRMYSLNSAWFTFDETKRGSLEPGKYADLAVLSRCHRDQWPDSGWPWLAAPTSSARERFRSIALAMCHDLGIHSSQSDRKCSSSWVKRRSHRHDGAHA